MPAQSVPHARDIQLDVPALIRSFVNLSLRLQGGQKTVATDDAQRLIAVNRWTLRFVDPQLELVYICYCLCTWGKGITLTPHWVFSEIAYIALLFVATFITPTPIRGQTDALFAFYASNNTYYVAFVTIACLDVVFWVIYRLLHSWRERALASTRRADWLPLARYLLATNAIVPLYMMSCALVVSIDEALTPGVFGLLNQLRFIIFFGAYGRLPVRYLEL
jgi:hypothetical protein